MKLYALLLTSIGDWNGSVRSPLDEEQVVGDIKLTVV